MGQQHIGNLVEDALLKASALNLALIGLEEIDHVPAKHELKGLTRLSTEIMHVLEQADTATEGIA